MAYDANEYRRKACKLPPDKIVAWITKHFEVKPRKEDQEYRINNPFNGDTGYHFNINPSKAVCHDWRGNEWAGPINPKTGKRNCSFIKFVRLYKNCGFLEAIQDVLQGSGNARDYLKPFGRTDDEEAKKKLAVELPRGAVLITESKDKQALMLRKWLWSRGYTDEHIKKHELYHLGMEVIWPYFEFDVLVYWQSRSRVSKRFNFPSLEIRDDNGKIIGTTDGSKGDFLYGFDDTRCAEYVIITEAIFDQHTLGDQALASGGAILTRNQIKKLKILGPKDGIILSPDMDEAGIKSVLSNYELLKNTGYDLYYSLPPLAAGKTKNDWNALGKDIGFDAVRSVHDNNITKITSREFTKLHGLLRDLSVWRK